MASFQSANSNSGGSEASNKPGPNFCPRDAPPGEHTILVESNEVHLIPLGNHKFHHKLEVAAQDTLDGLSTGGKRLTDDVIIFSSRSGVIFGRIPNSLSDDAVVQWLESFIHYVSTSEGTAWWHTGHSDPWEVYAFFPMNANRTKWIYSNTRNDKKRPLAILGILDRYAEEKSWLVQKPGREDVESYVAEVHGKCYIPRQHKRRRTAQRHKEQCEESESNPTSISFIWDAVEHSREVMLRDEEWKDGLLMERFEMSLI